MSIAYTFARSVFARSLTSGMSIGAEGLERIPQGGVVLVCNHACDADPGVLMRALPRPVGFLAASFMGRLPVFKTLLRRAGSVAIGSTTPRPWREQARALLQKGNALVVFPEGQGWLLAQDFDAELAPFHPGFASIAYDTGVPVLPMVIEGHETEIVPFKTSSMARRLADNPEELENMKQVLRYKKCTVHVLAPIEAREFVERPKEEAVPWLVDEARNRMVSALESLRAIR